MRAEHGLGRTPEDPPPLPRGRNDYFERPPAQILLCLQPGIEGLENLLL